MSLDVTLSRVQRTTVYDANITHNLGRMAAQAGIYDQLWGAAENGIKNAGQLINPLRKGIETMKSNPQDFKPYDAKNGWGTYEQFVPWLQELLDNCEQYPDAEISISK